MQRYVFNFVNSLVVIYASGLLSRNLNYVLAAGNMSLRKPTTRRSPGEPKLKEDEIGEGSSLGNARQLEYAPRVEPVIKTTTKKSFFQPSFFGDTEVSTRSKLMLPQWRDLFNRIIREEYP
jgi:hypothetical protein